MLKPIRAVILDMDGLMLDTEALARDVWPGAATACGYELPDQVFMSLIGRTRTDSDLILRQHFGPEFPMDEFRRACSEQWDGVIRERGIPIKKGLVELLDYLERTGIPVGVATSTARTKAQRSLKIAGLASRIRLLATGDEVVNGKPAPDIIRLAAERLGVQPDECLVFEDSINGIRAAQAAGAVPVMIPDLIEPDSETRQIAFRIFPSLCEALAWLDGGAGDITPPSQPRQSPPPN